MYDVPIGIVLIFALLFLSLVLGFGIFLVYLIRKVTR